MSIQRTLMALILSLCASAAPASDDSFNGSKTGGTMPLWTHFTEVVVVQNKHGQYLYCGLDLAGQDLVPTVNGHCYETSFIRGRTRVQKEAKSTDVG